MSERLALVTGGICGILMVLLGFGGVTFASGTRVGEYVLMLSTAPGLWQTVVLYKFLTRRERGLGALAMLYLVGSVIGGTLFAISANHGWLAARLTGSPSTLASLNVLDTYWNLISNFPGSAGTAALGLSILVSAALPRWIGIVAVLLGFGGLLLTLPLIVDSSVFNDQGPVFIAFQLVNVVWLLSLSVAMVLKSRSLASSRDQVLEPKTV
jgi:hypothetical protein